MILSETDISEFLMLFLTFVYTKKGGDSSEPPPFLVCMMVLKKVRKILEMICCAYAYDCLTEVFQQLSFGFEADGEVFGDVVFEACADVGAYAGEAVACVVMQDGEAGEWIEIHLRGDLDEIVAVEVEVPYFLMFGFEECVERCLGADVVGDVIHELDAETDVRDLGAEVEVDACADASFLCACRACHGEGY